MRIEVVGEGCPEVAVVAGIHGDEKCGIVAIERFLADHTSVTDSVAFVIANEAAWEAGERAIDEDLNRAFPGNADGITHESKLAARLLDAVRDKQVLDLHSTKSLEDADPPFGLVQIVNTNTVALSRATGVSRVVDISYLSGGLIAHVDGVAVECGNKGSSTAIDNAESILRRFLTNTGLIEGDATESNPEFYEIYDSVPKDGHEFTGRNFERIEQGEIFARTDDTVLRASEPFYPVLMSTDGYEDILGYKARKRGTIDEIAD